MTTITRYSDRYYSRPGDGFDGVGLVQTATALGSGTLLAGGRAVLTAAHVIEGNSGPVRVGFDTAGGRSWSVVESSWSHSGYHASYLSNDLALLWLEDEAPPNIPRYELYRGSSELGQIADLVGYGITGLGTTGATGRAGQRTTAQNRFETTLDVLDQAVGGKLWKAPVGSQLMADFDSGGARQDSFGRLLGRHDGGLGDTEGLIAPGDSGGPAFINGQLAGVASYITAFTSGRGERFDINDKLDGSFGEVAAWQRVSHYQSWIDELMARLSGGHDASPTPELPNYPVRLQGFDNAYYLDAKLQQLQRGGSANEWQNVSAADLAHRLHTDFGLTPEQHYERYGYREGLSPNALFDPQEYIEAKARHMVTHDGYETQQVARDTFLGLWQTDVYQHYLQYGAFEGVDPSRRFDTARYLADKLAALVSDPATATAWRGAGVEDVMAAFQQAGLSPLGHYMAFGRQEGLSPFAVPADERFVGQQGSGLLVDNSDAPSFEQVMFEAPVAYDHGSPAAAVEYTQFLIPPAWSNAHGDDVSLELMGVGASLAVASDQALLA